MTSTPPKPRPGRHARRLDPIARATIGWGVVFAVVHAYWAAGGEAGMGDEPATSVGARLYIGVIAILGLAGSAVAFLRTQPREGTVADRWPRLLARAGGAALLVGVAVGTGRWIAAGSLEGDGAAGVVTTLYFLAGGILFCTLGWTPRR